MDIKKSNEKIKKIEKVFIDQIEKQNKRIQRIKRKAAAEKSTKKYIWAGYEKEIKKQFKNLKDIFLYFVMKVIPLAYRTKAYDEADRLKKVSKLMLHRKIKIHGFAVIQAMSQADVDLMSKWHKGAIEILENDIVTIITAALNNSEKEVLTKIQRTQQQVLKDEQILELVEEGLQEVGSTQGVQKKIYQELKSVFSV